MTLQSSMAEALRLTRSGSLIEATAMIRSMLGGEVDQQPVDSAPSGIIDLKPERVTVEPKRDQPAPPRGSFEARCHVGSAGRMEYMLYRPASAAPAMPLVVMLHGCTQSPEDFAIGTGMNQLAEEFGFVVAYPRQTQVANQQRCWNWFRPDDQQRGRGEPALIASVVRDVIEAEGVDADRIYVAGLSAGGAAAAIMADAYPDLFAAVGVHSGLACGVARDLPSALAAMRRGGGNRSKRGKVAVRFVPLITFHGDRDGTVHETNAQELVALATAATGAPVDVEVETGKADGRTYRRALSRNTAGRVLIEQWTIAGAGHAWSGGSPAGSYADPGGPDASREMIRFFLEQEGAGG